MKRKKGEDKHPTVSASAGETGGIHADAGSMTGERSLACLSTENARRLNGVSRVVGAAGAEWSVPRSQLESQAKPRGGSLRFFSAGTVPFANVAGAKNRGLMPKI